MEEKSRRQEKDPSDSRWLEDLNPEQKISVCHGEGPLLVVAGAGTGKTRTLAYRVAFLIASGVNPERILLLTFTRRAAEEMIRRAASIVTRGVGESRRVWGGTFHSVANRLLRIYGNSGGLSTDFTVIDQADAEDLMDVARQELDLQSRRKRFPRKRTCLAIYSRCVNSAQPIEKVLTKQYPWCAEWKGELKRLFKRYVERKQQANVLDFDDLLLYLAELLRNTGLAAEIGGRFDHVLVDEYQDTNRIQARILRRLRQTNQNLTVVGDDAQSIYSFRAASIRNILDFPRDFENATVVSLEQNYRSSGQILETTNRVILQSAQRYTKSLWSTRDDGERPRLVTCATERDQDDFVVERVLEHLEEGVPLRRQAVLFRAAYLSSGLEVELASRNIPFHKYGGLRFLEAAHVKDLLGYLRVIENPRDEIAWFRILQILEGVGPATASKIVSHLMEPAHTLEELDCFPGSVSVRKSLKPYARLFRLIRSGDAKSPAEEVELIRKTYDPFLEDLYENPDMRRRDLENLQQIASRYESRRDFLTDLQLDPPVSTSELAGPPSRDEDWLVLSTIHSAKGCEWDVVYLIHASDGCLPSDMSTGNEEEIEEELRLTYVAMTRARNFLYVCWPLRYYHRGYGYSDRHSYAQLSRFLNDSVRQSMEEHAYPDISGVDDPEECQTSMNIGERIGSMWDE